MKIVAMDEVFRHIYNHRLWGGPGRSGKDSTPNATVHLRKTLKAIIKEYKITSLLDLPCGDYLWMKELRTELENTQYIGADILPEIISENKNKYPEIDFRVLNVINSKLPVAEAILVRDCFFVLTNKLIEVSLRNIQKSEIKWFLTSTYPGVTENLNASTGKFRRLNLCIPPFQLSKPALLINERSKYQPGKYLGLWECAKIFDQ